MEIITEHEFEEAKKLLARRENLAKSVASQLASFLVAETSTRAKEAKRSNVFIRGETLSQFKAYLVFELEENISFCVSKYSLCNVCIQIGSEMLSTLWNGVPEDRYLRSSQVRNILSMQLGRALDAFTNSIEYQDFEPIENLTLCSSCKVKVSSVYGTFFVHFVAVVDVKSCNKGWFLYHSRQMLRYLAAECNHASAADPPDICWSLVFRDDKEDRDSKKERIRTLAMLFAAKFKVNILTRQDILDTLLAEQKESINFKGFLELLRSKLAKRCIYDNRCRASFNLIQFEQEGEILKAEDAVRKYLNALKKFN